MEKLVTLILDKYDGSLKAEHGTGLNMSPYVEREWGEQATGLMWRVEGPRRSRRGPSARGGPEPRRGRSSPQSEDNPRDRGGRDHLRRVRLLRAGLPEPPPDQHAEAANRDPPGDGPTAGGIPGAAGTARAIRVRRGPDLRRRRGVPDRLPLGIDTGALIKGFRAKEHTAAAQRQAAGVAGAGPPSSTPHAAGSAPARSRGPLMRAGSAAARSLFSDELVPAGPGKCRPRLRRGCHGPPARVRLPSTCPPASTGSSVHRHRTGRAGGAPSHPAAEAMVAVSARAGMPVWIPDDVAGNCCSVPWSSKGYTEGAALMANRTVAALWRWSGRASCRS